MAERIVFTQPNKAHHIRSGELASVESFDKDSFFVRKDSGESIALSEAEMRHIDHGYALTHIPKGSQARIIVTGDSELLARQQAQLSSMSPRTAEIQLYTSDSRSLGRQLTSVDFNLSSTPNPSKDVSVPAFEIGR